MVFPQTTRLALLGQAVGDAFGAPFEYNEEGPRMARLSLNEERYLDACTDVGQLSRWARLPGLYTDDTQQALALLHAWRTVSEPLDPDAVAARFTEIVGTMYDTWLPGTRAGVHRGTGKNFREVLKKKAPVDTAGLGAAMRIGPVSTLLPDLHTLLPWTVLVSRATTTNPLGLASAALFAAHCHAEATGTAEGLIDRLLMWLDSPAASALALPREIWLDLLRAIEVMDTLGEPDLLEFAAETGYSSRPLDNAADGFALTGVAWVLFHANRSESFTEALEGVCSSGGDADTVAAMTGCLAGLRLGTRSIPTWMIDNLVGGQGVLEPELWDPIRSERRLTQREEEYRRETRLRRSREFWQDVGLSTVPVEGEEDDDDPLSALQEAEEFWTEEAPLPPPDDEPVYSIDDDLIPTDDPSAVLDALDAPDEEARPVTTPEGEPASPSEPPGKQKDRPDPDPPRKPGEQLNLFSRS
jgi:ADP-ribosylglycohydrolase